LLKFGFQIIIRVGFATSTLNDYTNVLFASGTGGKTP
jgi:hypothetical protein